MALKVIQAGLSTHKMKPLLPSAFASYNPKNEGFLVIFYRFFEKSSKTTCNKKNILLTLT
jgi:hypothetical protein